MSSHTGSGNSRPAYYLALVYAACRIENLTPKANPQSNMYIGRRVGNNSSTSVIDNPTSIDANNTVTEIEQIILMCHEKHCGVVLLEAANQS